ncbi:protein of unknown function DUF488 [Hyphomicrobium denitrificans ATCC 51888]|uniref:Uroporphyrin-III C-methyltransferase n=1 Tax=Hyphomicrobium denitrificans (strain ATCC 51888 / DSM 1869 / NCIMB 11706 / TK 0415) TaxID=582899 RepID=D8JV59_HYPDA|nr:DUF488 domain-containing protein [Hyphomicrobium denitrificans]ADJ22875.1 protein of unknown function DUF488 [Hyphomicrobium denitrificans ATCC 51888]
MVQVQLKRIYEPPQKSDGYRVLVDRVWPRGLSKDAAQIDLWMKDIAPSTALRKWFNHDPARWVGFQEKYRAELHELGDKLDELRARAKKEPVTLLYGAKDTEHNQAVVLRDVLAEKRSRSATR